ncbi:MAG: ATP synthase subunit C [Verrucomicrobia bacterium]|jgi:V/A-type H+-transporting ATPase subunit K|nr:ATP synthase subunit C [Verrucomicrobiota bacterium]
MKWIRYTLGVLVAAGLLCGAAVLGAEVGSDAVFGDAGSDYRAIGLGAAAAFAVGAGVLGAAYAVGRIGSAALGAAAEKPELLPRSILFVALAEGLAVLGFAIAMMLLQKI